MKIKSNKFYLLIKQTVKYNLKNYFTFNMKSKNNNFQINKKFNNKKIVIIGSGFRAMMTAFFCLRYTNDVSLISNNKNIHGIMSPIKWLGGNFDKGYHFFDGFNDRLLS